MNDVAYSGEEQASRKRDLAEMIKARCALTEISCLPGESGSRCGPAPSSLEHGLGRGAGEGSLWTLGFAFWRALNH